MNSITSIQTTTIPKTINTVTTPQHKPPKLQHQRPVRSFSYDHDLFKRQMYMRAYNNTIATSSPSLDDATPTLNSYTGLSSPLLTPIETNDSSSPADISDFMSPDLSSSLLNTRRSHNTRHLSYDRNLYKKVMFSLSTIPSSNNDHLSYTGLSSPKFTNTITTSSNRPSSPFSTKKITDDFLFRDNWPQEVIPRQRRQST
nr:10797_t:CDS:2 [Entrophospora candida]